ncbi:cobaltochelatase subunit CobN, partial [Methanococcus maripaludis]
NGAELYCLRPMTSSLDGFSYFDYVSDGNRNDTVCDYFQNMGTDEEGVENAENLLVYLAAGAPGFVETVTTTGGKVDPYKYVFVLGSEINQDALNSAILDETIADDLNITVFTKDNPVPEGFDFSDYGMIFIESQNESLIDDWLFSLLSAKKGGAKVIGYNLSPNVSISNVDLRSNESTDIERYWVQGGEENLENMIKLMGQKFSGLWTDEVLSEPEILKEKVNITFIDSAGKIYYLNQVIEERKIITDNFNVRMMTSEEAVANITDASDQDIIILYMASDISSLEPVFADARDNYGMDICFVASPEDSRNTLNLSVNNVLYQYVENDGTTNMENFVRYVGAEVENQYIEYAPVADPAIPIDGIYHPDAFPRIFADSTEYLEWYKDHGYNESAPTIGIITYEIESQKAQFATDDAIIRYLESQGCNVIYTTNEVCRADVDYLTKDGEVLVDAIISLPKFSLGNPQEEGVEYLKYYNVPVLKGILDSFTTVDEYYNSTHGVDPLSLAMSVTMPEIDGCIDYIFIAGRNETSDSDLVLYEPIQEQVEWLCDRAIGQAELGRTNNSDKKITILYWNHEGGKESIGSTYLDIGSSFTLILEEMQAEGYDIGNGTIPDGDEFYDLFIASRNVGAWAPGELEKVVESGNAILLPLDDYLEWYNNDSYVPQSVRDEVEGTWGEAPGEIMTYTNNTTGEQFFVIPTVQMGNINFIPQPTKAFMSSEALIYHDTSIPLTHQYLATYFWINHVFDADAIVHFGTHGSQEWSGGKEVGIWRYDYPALCVEDTPVIYPYIMDNVGEGSQAKHRGNAVLVDYLTPAIVEAGLYGDLADMHEKIHNYEDAISNNNTNMSVLYRNTLIELYENNSMEYDLNVTTEELQNMTDEDFEFFMSNNVHNYLHELQSMLMPYGVHTFGVAPEGEELICMIKSMLRDDFIDHIYAVIPEEMGDEEDREDLANEYAYDLLNATVLDGTNVSDAQMEILGVINADITADLNTGLGYADDLANTTQEITNFMRALNAEFIEPAPGNDPVRNPSALPTGRNFYGFDQRKFPDAETMVYGYELADQLLTAYNASHGTYPDKVSYTLWAIETFRHHGVMEAQIYAMLGVKPVSDGITIVNFTVIPIEELGRPRIDVLVQSSGLYRDTFPFQLETIDKAIRLVAELNESYEDNYVKMHSDQMEAQLIELGYNETEADFLSKCRIFSEATGNYGNGMDDAIEASETWDNETKLADFFISTTSHIYGADVWGDKYEDVFTMNLMDIDACVHSDSTNLYGIIDNDDYYAYLGGMALTIRVLTGETPEEYIANLENVADMKIISLNEAFRTELRSRYLNPLWIEGMMEADYAGAFSMMKFTEYLWGWDVTNPEMVTDADWDMVYDVYINDKYDMGLDEFLMTENPYQFQAMTARMMETARKDYWNADDAVLENLANEFIQSVVEYGVTCCHHTCGNLELNDWAVAHSSLDEETLKEYERLYEEATHKDIDVSSETETTPTSSSSESDSYSKVYSGNESVVESVNATNATMVTNTTVTEDAAASAGSDGGRSSSGSSSSASSSESSSSSPSKTQKAYEVTVANEPEQSETSGTTVIAIVGAVAMTGLVGVGYFKQNPEIFTNIINALKLLRRR